MLSIANEVNPLIFPLRMFFMQYKHVFFQQLVSEWSLILNCITCFVSFEIRESNIKMLEDLAINFLHGD